MAIDAELRDTVGAYVDGRLSSRALQVWFDDHIQELHDANGGALLAFTGRAFSLLMEWTDGHRDEISVRDELDRALRRETLAGNRPDGGSARIAAS